MNTITLIGRLTRDPDLDQTRGGTPVCRLRLAVPRRRKEGKDQGAVFVSVVAFGGQAAAAADYLMKGRQVAVSGRLEQREWSDGDGTHSLHEVVADHVQFLGQPSQNGTGTGNGDVPAAEPA